MRIKFTINNWWFKRWHLDNGREGKKK